ncbi:MAG: SCO family protein [Vicinamibacterales bacterium]
MRRARARRPGALLALALVGALAGCRQEALPVHGIGGDFRLTGHDGRPFDSASLRGDVVLVFFGYSSCPDACPTTLSKLARATARLEPGDRAHVKTLYVSVDPDRDTPAVLKTDLENFDLDALGLTGTKAEIDRVVQLFGASYTVVPLPDSAAKYSIMHTTLVYALDGQGRVRTWFPYEATVDEIEAGLRRMLADRG